MGEQAIEFIRLESAQAIAEETARRMSAAARRAIRARGRFLCVLAGGRTPLAAYSRLVDQPEDWAHWHLFLGDERCLPPDDPERNSRAIELALTERVAIPPDNLHWIPAESGAESAAGRYDALIADHMPFDLILLGMGEDGHTASLFPGHVTPTDVLASPVHEAPKPPPDRVTLTPLAFASAPERLILVTGAGKRKALAAWRRGADLPVARIAALGRTDVLMDSDAAGD
ncbi:6-phosphogluconolactonase [Thiocapsa roseopersicina]|uniref:6-phosphogluconolactonase n=1 Tax=Thiocapsa roseopersicina TaxID=1058 RepID=A0A1H2RSD7_THIRO|nr:6-phosphogluconolactonase [Thiocapsa roseopersicina]SDW22060.1 6-phosphogluconolactonase [Thiocapsa roseopersicina]